MPTSPERYDPGLQPLVDQAREDLATALGVQPTDITVKSAAMVTWSDPGFLGPGRLRQRQVPIDGSEIVLVCDAVAYRYRTGGDVYRPTLFSD